AQRLIAKPSESILTYEQEAIQEILKLSAGHPYFTQVICFTLFLKAMEESNQNATVTRTDVVNIVERIFHDDNAQAGLVWFWDGLPIPEKVVFSAVAEAQKRANTQANNLPEEPLALLMEYGVIPTDDLIKAAERLSEKGFLDNTERRIKVELVRLWLVRYHQLDREISELEKLEQKNVIQLFSVANNLYSQGNKQNAIQLYNQILGINPNHFQTILELAKWHLEIENFDQALEFYQRAYQFDPIRNKDILLDTLQNYGHSLFIQKEFAKARQQYDRVLVIQPNCSSAQQRLAEIRIFESNENTSHINPTPGDKQKKSVKVLLGVGIVAVIAISAVSRVYRLFSPCPPGEQEKFGILCVVKGGTNSGNRDFPIRRMVEIKQVKKK
ncbi:tetratricopeptide repeat protein, partial [Moorena sp. SIO3H5]|uniref:tetratricopeptide repeat protein n=1 Tax=Moorena sp. SIO3H5 TaxID=2607834 RepID=UPI0013BC23FA|nr:branched-chain amino acid ABC transporter substrate-binding protein [Moorena sp. SIO3H5]